MNRVCQFFMIGVLAVFVELTAFGQSASISPSRFYYKLSPGVSGTQLLRVTNNGDRMQSFQVTFSNFSSQGQAGKTTIEKNADYEHGCSGWLSASPAFFDVAPGETRDVEIRMQVPTVPEAMSVRWAAGLVKLVSERQSQPEKGADVTGMQIIQTFQFLFHVFQTPPSLQLMKEAQVTAFEDVTTPADSSKVLRMEVLNSGKAIVDCVPYLDVVNLNSGESQRVVGKAFTVLPGGTRQVKISLPDGLVAAKYSVLGVVDYGSTSELSGAELVLEVP